MVFSRIAFLEGKQTDFLISFFIKTSMMSTQHTNNSCNYSITECKSIFPYRVMSLWALCNYELWGVYWLGFGLVFCFCFLWLEVLHLKKTLASLPWDVHTAVSVSMTSYLKQKVHCVAWFTSQRGRSGPCGQSCPQRVPLPSTAGELLARSPGETRASSACTMGAGNMGAVASSFLTSLSNLPHSVNFLSFFLWGGPCLVDMLKLATYRLLRPVCTIGFLVSELTIHGISQISIHPPEHD